MKAIRSAMLVAAAATLLVAAAAPPTAADSSRRLVSRGNGLLRKGDADGAIEQYERASVDAPESPVVGFNIGAALFRKGEFASARERFVEAAEKTRELDLEAAAWYNAGNCAFREGQRMLDGDLGQALERFQESVRFYAAALEKDGTLEDAAWNLELARLSVKDVLDRIERQREEMKAGQEALREVADSLVALAERQRGETAASDSLALSPDTSDANWRQGVEAGARAQRSIGEGVDRAAKRLGELFPGEVPAQIGEALSHLDSALVDGTAAAGDLDAADPGAAAGEQRDALIQLMKAIQALAGDGSGGENGGDRKGNGQEEDGQGRQPPPQQEQQAREGQARDETARGIIDEEKESRKERRRSAGGYRSVDRDW
ncbi:MAG: hypothetical protein JW876_01380 [Candidatus Krumholzibacteriota bacterium]|nr:hypothetical protein [Candidatus Krumholzibacteriota bacterium]